MEASQITEKEKNIAIIKKLSEDVLDISDSLTIMVAELKPYRP